MFPILSTSQKLPTICLDNNVCYEGSWQSLVNSRYASFQGIRYAQPPIGELRFKDPLPYNTEEGTYNVGNESNVICPQLGLYSNPVYDVYGQEDCLLLNIYVPENAITDPQNKLPVMFWIYGGGLVGGEYTYHSYGPNQFMKSGKVIFVAVNYRLGPLGFLSMGNNMIPGNAGLKDQVMALKWVKENIVNFGGDPDIVTIFGESAGSLSVSLHLISPLSKGLFHRAILQSGTAIGAGSAVGTVTAEKAIRYANILSRELGCDQANSVIVCLQGKNMKDIIRLEYSLSNNLIWLPSPDINFASEPFLPGDPEELMKSGQFNSEIDVIIGTNEKEGLFVMEAFIVDPTLWVTTKYNIETLLPMYLFNIAEESDVTADDVAKMYTILEYYIGSVDNFNEEHINELIDMFTDADFLYGTYKTIKYCLDQDMTIFQYILTYQGIFSFTQNYGIAPMGVCHLDDLIYLFDPCLSLNLRLPQNDWLVRELMTSAWINFATTGDPTPPNSGLSWTPMESPNNFFNISGPYPVMTNNQEIQSRMEFWDRVLA